MIRAPILFSRRLILTGISFLFFFVLWKSSWYLISQLHYLKARQYSRAENLIPAVEHLNKAIKYSPDNYKVRILLGDLFYSLAITNSPPHQGEYLHKAKLEYNLAVELNQYDAEAWFKLAVAEGTLETINSYNPDFSGSEPHNALPYYKEAIRLWPNAGHIYYHYIRYLYARGEQRLLWDAVKNSARIFPEQYRHLKQESFWSHNLNVAFKEGLQQSVNENLLRSSALRVMTTLLEDEKNWIGASQYYEKFINLYPDRITSANYLKLGKIYLEAGLFNDAEAAFSKSMSISLERDKNYTDIIRTYRHHRMVDEMYRFHERVGRENPISVKAELYVASSLTALKNPNKAELILRRLAYKESSAEAYFNLAQLAGKGNDWERAAREIKAAIDLDSRNAEFHMFLSNVFLRLNKKKQAEYEASLAIEYANEKKDQFYFNRARIRSSINNLWGALGDYETAIKINPGNHFYYSYAARLNEKIGDLEKAIEYYKNASQLTGNNKDYITKIEKLEKMLLSEN